MEAEKITLKLKIFLLSCKLANVVLRSFNFLSKLMLAVNCVWFYLNRFCREVNNLMYLTTKRIQTKRTQFAAYNTLDKKLKDQSGALHSSFFAILHHKGTELKTYGF